MNNRQNFGLSTFFVDEQEAFGIIYGYDPITGKNYEMEEFDECEVGLAPPESELLTA